ncbi:hypothetical protein [Curtobacterium phage Reje]|uniref:hypothetical protein n=1 Tax=Curtobacterium phage Reje TaxID=2851069 RepID=UPI0021FFFFB9|nr:hypothetical protein QEJ62_gp14 [Curtobacterium phage Reje]QXG07822.1 hypothetical protein [Curtobacterium phage Reje]
MIKLSLKNNIVAVLTTLTIIFVIGLLALLIILDKKVDVYIGSLTTLTALLVTNGIIGQRLDKVSKNVNGNTHRLMNENAKLREMLGIPNTGSVPVPNPNGFTPSDPIMSEDTMLRIRRDADSLPSHER